MKQIAMQSEDFSFRNRMKSFKFAFQGIKTLLSKEHNAFIHLFAAICVIIAGILLRLSSLEWIVITIVICMVLAAEAFNTAIEKIADFISPEYHATIKDIKDMAAGGVLLAAIAAAVTGCIILIPKFIALL